jgi:surface antigen
VRIGLVLAAAAVVALIAMSPASRAARTNTPIIYGYPYAPTCPLAGVAKRVDRFGMYACNCTSYVAWALHANGLRTNWFIPGAMDAFNWPHVARLKGLQVVSTPAVGAVAVMPRLGGRLGHVAFVTGLGRGESFSVAEYNLPSLTSSTHFEFDVRNDVSSAGTEFILVPRTRAPSQVAGENHLTGDPS